jgi:tetratricopeptide (TPR) repeat protein
MNTSQNNRQAPEEIRVLVACNVGALHAERALLERAVFPDLRRAYGDRGIVFTDIDLLRHAGDVSHEHLLRSCVEEIHRNHPLIIGLLQDDGAAGNGIVETVAATAATERSWFYARSTIADRDPARTLARRVRRRDLRLREGWRDPSRLADWVREDLLSFLAGLDPLERGPALERERRTHETFAASCRIGTFERPELIALLDEHIESAGAPLLILGPSGAGKSTLIAQWCAGYRLRAPDAFMIAHHVEASGGGLTGEDVVRRIIEEIRNRTGAVEIVPPDTSDPVRDLPLHLARLGHERLMLLLDGVDQLSDGASLEWLPAFLPANVRVIVTSSRPPGIGAASAWRVHRMREFTRNERFALGAMHSGRSRADLAGEQIARVVEDASIATPLAFRVRLEELRLKGERTRSMGNAAHFAAATGIDDLIARLVVHWEEEFGAAPIERLLTALAGARVGLTHRELAEYVGGSELALADMLTALDLHLLRLDGRIRLFHDAFRRSVEARYLATPAERADLHGRLAALFIDGTPADRRAAETAWHLRQGGDRERLLEHLRHLDVARTFVAREREHELVEHWMFAADADAMVVAYTNAIDAPDSVPPRERIAAMLDVGAIFRRAGRVRDSLAMLKHAADLAGEERADGRTNGAIAVQLAPLLATAGNLREAEERYRAGLAELRAEYGDAHPAVARVLGELAGVLAATGRHAEAEEEYRAALGMLERCGAGVMQIAPAVNDLATVLHEIGRYAEAEALYRRALDLWASCGGETHPDAVATVSNLAALHFDHGENHAARAEHERVVALWEMTLGRDHPIVATALSNLATQITRDDPDAAVPLLERALAIHEAAYSAPTHETAVILYTIGYAHYYAGRLDAAEPPMRRAHELQRELLGVDHVDTAVTLSGLATLLRDRGDYTIAEHLLRQALDVLERNLGPRHPRVIIMLMNLARLARRRGEPDKARRLALQAHAMLEEDGDNSAARETRAFLDKLDAEAMVRPGE